MLVGVRFGRFFSHKQVAFFSPCPYCHGCIIWVGDPSLDFVERTPIGFSIAILSIRAFHKSSTKVIASCCSFCFSLNHRAPLTHRCVHGGNAINMSHLVLVMMLLMLSCMWFPGVSDGRRSTDQALCPRRVNASRTRPLNSQAISTFIACGLWLVRFVWVRRRAL